MANILIIGSGGVGRVVALKSTMLENGFDTICLASRSLENCSRIQKESGDEIIVDQVDACHADAVERLIRKCQADIVINVALPYQNLPIMDACLATETHYIDTAVPEIPTQTWHDPDDIYWYGLQWNYHKKFLEKNITGILGIGSDPGMVNVFCTYAEKELFDDIHTIDIMDVNAGDHGYPFATNFNPEINLRELMSPAFFWQQKKWYRREPFSIQRKFVFPEIGQHDMYLMDHDEIHSLNRKFPTAHHIRFWMGFSPQFIDYIETFRSLNMLSVNPIPVETEGGKTYSVVPLKMLKSLLPDPSSLGRKYKGKICIGCLIRGTHSGKEREIFIYNLCDHRETYREVGSQAVSYAAGVPPVIAAMLLQNTVWRKPGVFNVEQLDHHPFMELLPKLGMPWKIREGG